MGILSPRTCWEGTAVTSLPPAIISSGPVIHIKFVSDYAHQGAGFSLRYEIYKTGEWAQSCCCHVVKETDHIFPRKISVPDNEQLKHSHPIV